MSVFLPQSLFVHSSILKYPHEAEWTPFQTHYLSENVVAQEIEPGTCGTVARNSVDYTTEAAGLTYTLPKYVPT
jgi:hypothetical protein